MSGRPVRSSRLVAVGVPTLAAAAWLALLPAAIWNVSPTTYAQAPTTLGNGTCGGSECHANVELTWLTSKPGGQEHYASFRKLKQARDNSEKYTKAVGLAKFDDPAGMCVKCHATYLVKAQTFDGVGCESCHGAASGYRDFHSKNSKDRAGSINRGMRDLLRKPNNWIGVCQDCHVLGTKYEALIDAGHKDGARWKVSQKYVSIQAHWKETTTYTVAQIAEAAAGKPVVGPVVTPPPPVGPAANPETMGAPKPPLPEKPRITALGGREVAPAPITAVPPPDPPPGPTLPPLSLTPSPAASAAGMLAALQDGVAVLLASMLRADSVFPASGKPLAPFPQVAGPDGDLLRLQYEALALAVEALNLRARPAKPGPPK